MPVITFKDKIDILNFHDINIIVNEYKGNVTNVTFDSRKILPNSIFFALEGENTDGHQFVYEALNCGADVAIVKKILPEYRNIRNKTIVQVSSPIKFMASLAKEYRKEIKADVIGITGTIGKTTTKYLTSSALSRKFSILVAPGSYNNLLGLSYTLLNYNNEEKIILELGVNHIGEMDELVEIARPDIAVITHITPVHMEGMRSVFDIFKEKQKITKYAKKIIINSDSFLLNSIIHHHLIKVGTGDNLHYRGFIVKNDFDKTQFVINNEFFEIPSCFKSILYPSMFSYALCKEYGISYEEIYDAFLKFSLPELRAQVIKKGERIIIADCYNASPQSMLTAIEQFVSICHSHTITNPELFIPDSSMVFILGDMLELGEKSAFYHRKIASIIKQFKGLKILVGSNFKSGSDFLTKSNIKHYYFMETQELLKALPKILTPEYKFILLKASRKLQLEKLIEYL